MLNFVLCDDNLSFLNNLEKTLDKLIIKNDFRAKVGFKSTKILGFLAGTLTLYSSCDKVIM